MDAQHPNLENVFLVIGAVKDLGEDIDELIVLTNQKKTKQVTLKPFANHMTINVYMLSTFMEGGVVGDVSCELIIIIEHSRKIGLNMQVVEEIIDPLNLECSSGKRPILCF